MKPHEEPYAHLLRIHPMPSPLLLRPSVTDEVVCAHPPVQPLSLVQEVDHNFCVVSLSDEHHRVKVWPPLEVGEDVDERTEVRRRVALREGFGGDVRDEGRVDGRKFGCEKGGDVVELDPGGVRVRGEEVRQEDVARKRAEVLR